MRRVRINRIFAILDIRAALHGLKAQQVRSPGQRPGLTYVPPLRPVRAKVINNRCAHTFALTGRRRLYTGTQGVALGWELAALSGRSRRRFELIEFLQRGCGAAPQFIVGLRRRNNELNELTNCCAARRRGIAPERGSYSRIGARPYLPPHLSDSRCCPCKGRISWAGLAPQ